MFKIKIFVSINQKHSKIGNKYYILLYYCDPVIELVYASYAHMLNT